MERRARVIPRGRFPDSAVANLDYWCARSPDERVAAVEDLRQSTYRLFHGRDLPKMRKVAKVVRRAA